MVKTAKSAEVDALLMMRTENDPFRTSPPNARLFCEFSLSQPCSLCYISCALLTDQTADEFEVVDLPVLGVTYQVGQTLRDIASGNVMTCYRTLPP